MLQKHRAGSIDEQEECDFVGGHREIMPARQCAGQLVFMRLADRTERDRRRY